MSRKLALAVIAVSVPDVGNATAGPEVEVFLLQLLEHGHHHSCHFVHSWIWNAYIRVSADS